MSRSVSFRYAWLTGLLLLLALAACRGATATPGVSLAASPTQVSPKLEVSPVASPTEPTPAANATLPVSEPTVHPSAPSSPPPPREVPPAQVSFPALIRTIDFGIAAGSLAELKVGGGRLYVTDSSGRLHTLDSTTYRELATLPVAGALTFDPAHSHLYVDAGESLAVVDTAALTVTAILTPGGSVGWDPKRNRLYVGREVVHQPPRFGIGGEVYDGETLEKLGEMPVGGKVVYNPLRDELLIVAFSVYRADPETLELIGDLLPDISAQECPGCDGISYASDVQVIADRNLLVVTMSRVIHGVSFVTCGAQRAFDATTLEPVSGPTETHPWEPTCNSRRSLSEAQRNRVYEGLVCRGRDPSSYSLVVYDLRGERLTWRDGIDTGVINPNTCQGYVARAAYVLVLDLPSLTPAGALPQAAYTVDAEGGRVYGVTGTKVLVYAETGGRPDTAPPPGERGPLPEERIVWLEASPDFSHDLTLFAGLSGPNSGGELDEVYRSTDGGASWARLHGGLPEGEDVRLSLAVSPGFADDHTLFAGARRYSYSWGEGVLRSTDGGDTWQPMWDGLVHLRVDSIALSPLYASDGTLRAYSDGWTVVVSRSTDRGLHWTQVDAGTVPIEELLPADPRSPGLRFRASAAWGWVERRTAEGQSWQPVFRLAGQGIAAVLPSPHVGSDGTVFVLTQAGLFRSADRGDSWARCPEERLDGRDATNEPTTAAWAGDQLAVGTAKGEVFFVDPAALDCEPVELELSPDSWPSPVPVPRPTMEPGPSPTPKPPPTPIPETPRVSEQFAAAYADGWIATRLHGPLAEAGTTQAAFQQFEHGLMIARGDTKEIYVLYGDGSRDWPVYHDTWDESQPVDDPARVPPPGLFQPVRGFGKLWRTEVGLADKLGWALAPEQSYEMLVQEFQGGTMLLGPEDEIYVLLPFWTWERR